MLVRILLFILFVNVEHEGRIVDNLYICLTATCLFSSSIGEAAWFVLLVLCVGDIM